MNFLNGNTTKDKIIETLSDNISMSAKQVFNTLQKQHALNISYQLVHKTLKHMIEEETLTFENHKYEINKNWVLNSKRKLEAIEEKITNQKFNKQELMEKGNTLVEFDTFIDVAKFILGEFSSLPNPKIKPFISQVYHIWPAIALSPEMFRQFKEIHEKEKHYILGAQDTFIDKIASKTFEQHGGKIKRGAQLPFTPDTLVHGDYIAQVYFEPKGKKLYDQICQATSKILDINLRCNTLFETAFKHKVLLIHNQKIADEIREDTIRQFKEATK